MTKDEKFMIVLKLIVRFIIFLCFEAIGIAWKIFPALSKCNNQQSFKSTFENFSFNLAFPEGLVIFGLCVLIGLADWCLKFTWNLKTALGKTKSR